MSQYFVDSYSQPYFKLADLLSSLSPYHLLVPLLLVLLCVAYAKARSPPKRMSYVVKWGKERLTFPLPPPDTKLAVIRNELAEHTHLPADSFKLIHAGAIMKDDSAPISAYGIRNKSKIAIIGGGDLPSPPQRKSEESVISLIQSELDKVRSTLCPSVDKFLDVISTPPSTDHPPEDSLDHEHTRLGELLLQSLLRLDAITPEGEWEQARKERKAGVREVQSVLDRLDSAWKSRT